jgi:signal transduction histidine kinase
MTRELDPLAGSVERRPASHDLVLPHRLLDAFEGCLLCVDAGGIVTVANRYASELLSSEDGGLLGSSFLTLPEAKNQRALAQAVHAAQAGRSVHDLDLSHRHGSRTRVIRWSLTSMRELGTSDEEATAEEARPNSSPMLLAVGIDVTERLEHERQNAEDDAMAVMGTLAAGLAHGIRNPLNAATLQLELLLSRARRAGDASLQSQLAEPAALVQTAIGRLAVLLDEFLHVAQPREPVRLPSSIAELFETVLAHKRPLMEGLGLILLSKVSDVGLLARCDSAKIKQVLVNLIRNCIDALGTRGYGLIELHAEPRAGGGVSLAVLDDGPGLAGHMHGDAAFQPFTTTKAAGTGLGLSIARKIVSQHGGTIQLSARPGGGTAARFWISE